MEISPYKKNIFATAIRAVCPKQKHDAYVRWATLSVCPRQRLQSLATICKILIYCILYVVRHYTKAIKP